MINDFSIDMIGIAKNTSFLGNTNEPKKGVSISTNNESDKISKTAKNMLGATAVAAIIIGGLLFKNHTNPSSVDFKIFKKIGGHFEKGKAFLKEKAYSGKLYSISKNGEMRIVEYKNGIIQSSKKSSKDLCSKKDYSYHPNGKLKDIKQYSGNCENDLKLDKETLFTLKGSIKTKDVKGKVVSEVKVKADKKLAYNADKCISRKIYDDFTSYCYLKDGKPVVYEEIQVCPEYKSISTNNLVTGKTTQKKVYKDGSSDLLKEGSWGSNNSEVEHINSKGITTGYTRIENHSTTYEKPFGLKESYYDGDMVQRWEEKFFDANHKLIRCDNKKHITPKEQSKSSEYFG